jgi:hypothetical protein
MGLGSNEMARTIYELPGEREFASGVTATQGILDADVMLHGFHSNFQRSNRLLNVMIVQVTYISEQVPVLHWFRGVHLLPLRTVW